jgi:hypothetical protein
LVSRYARYGDRQPKLEMKVAGCGRLKIDDGGSVGEPTVGEVPSKVRRR